MDQAAPARKSFWRFSLRELLLLMTAAAATLALIVTYYQRSRPFVPTKISSRFGDIETIQTALQRIGFTRPGLFQGGGGPSGGTSPGDESCSVSWHYVLDIGEEQLVALIDELKRQVEGDIEKEGGKDAGSGFSEGMGHKHCHLKYRAGQTFGEVHLIGLPMSEKKSRLFIFVHEHRIRP